MVFQLLICRNGKCKCQLIGMLWSEYIMGSIGLLGVNGNRNNLKFHGACGERVSIYTNSLIQTVDYGFNSQYPGQKIMNHIVRSGRIRKYTSHNIFDILDLRSENNMVVIFNK